MSTRLRLSAISAAIFLSSQAHAAGIVKPGDLYFQLGGYLENLGESQYVDVDGMQPLHFTIDQHRRSNAFVGVGYYLPALSLEDFTLDYGFNGFYMFPIETQGNIVDNSGVSTLEYSYTVGNLPLYVGLKANFKNPVSKLSAFTMDVGIGPNFMSTYSYHDKYLVNGSVPYTEAFEGTTTTTFTAMGGIGLRMYQLFGPMDFELSYRFFYFGEGQLNSKNSIVHGDLKTGDVFANAIMFAVIL